MELWILFVLFHIVTLIIIYLLDYNFLKWVFKNPEFPCIISSLAFFPVIVFWFYKWVDFSNIFVISAAFGAWILAKIGSYAYFKWLDTWLSPWLLATIYKMQMVVIFIFWVLILDEKLTFAQTLGHGLIFLGAIAFSFDHIKFSKNTLGIVLIFISMLAYSFSSISVDHLYKLSDFFTVFTFFTLGYFLSAFYIIFWTVNGKKFFFEFSKRWKLYLWLWLFMEFFWILELVFWNLALKNWPLTLVIFLTQTYVIGLFLVSFIGGYFYPKVFPDSEQKSKWLKLWIISMMLLWVYLAVV